MSESISGFDPRSVPDCIVWLDAADISTLTLSGTNVTGWRDKSIYANNVNSISATPPTYSSVDSSINFVANSSTFLRGALSATYTDAAVFMVVSIATNPAPAFPRLSILSNSATLNSQLVGQLFLVYGNNPSVIVYLSTGTNPTGQGTNIITYVDNVTFNTRQLISNTSTYNGTNYTVSTLLNGNTQTFSSTSGTFTPNSAYTANYNKYSLGNYADASAGAGDALQGKIFEYIVFSRELTVTERQQVEGYLGWKWGIESTPILPSSISGLAMWLDGADPSTLFTDTSATTAVTADGNSIAAWRDKSTNAYLFTQATAGSRPTYKTSILNGRSITRWNGTSTFLQSSATLPFYTSSTSGGSFFVVFMATTVTSQRFLMTYQNEVTNTYCGTESELGYTTGNGGQGNFGMHQGCSRATIAASVTIVINSYVLMSYILATTGTTPANSTIFKNGTSLTPSNDQTGFYSAGSYPSANNARFLNIGARVFNGSQATDCWHSGDIAELIWYRVPLSTTERQGIESYLSSKWNISVPTQALPVSHPFASIRPFSRYFNPIDIQGCVLWLDAADFSTITRSGVNMTQWNDKSGLANNMVPFSTFSNATVMSNYWYGLNVLNFSGVAVYQAPASSAVYPIDVYIVMALKDLTTHVDVFSLTPSAAVDNFNNLGFSEYITSRWYNGSSGFARTPNTASATNETSTSFLLMNWSIANNNFVIRRNGTQLSQTASYTWTMTAGSIFQLGWRISPLIFSPGSFAGAFRGYIGEIVAFNSQLSTSQRQVVESYLASKWGLVSSLPATHPFSKFPPSSAVPFLPTNISGCALWLDAADLSSITLSGSSVIQWNDKSGNNRNASGGASPTFLMNGVIFNGTSQYLATTYSAVPSSESVFVVVTWTGTADRNYCIIGTSATNGRNYNVLKLSGSNVIKWDKWGVAGYASTPGVLANVRFLSSGIYNGTTGTTGLNGGAQSTAEAFTFSGSGITHIGTGVLGDWFTGTINEIIIYNRAVTVVERQLVEGYLASKWGLQNSLPSTHPYRTFQPAQTSFVIITPGTIATVTLSALSGSGGTITWTTSTNAVSYKWYVGTTYPTALTSGTVGAVLTTSVSYAFIASTNYYAWVIPVSSTGTDGATTQSAAASYSAGGGITVSSSGTAADMTAAANTISGSFAGVDDSFGQLPCISFGINGTSGYTTAYVGTNGYITFASGQGNIPSANNPGVPSIPAIKIRGFDSRGISCTYASGSKPSNANITYTRIVGNWYPYYSVYAGLIPLEIFLVRDATATKQYIWIKIGSSYNNNGYGDSDWAVTNGSSYLVNVAYPGAGTSIVFESSGFTGASWTATSPGSLVGLLT